jgi:hypothetical protein
MSESTPDSGTQNTEPERDNPSASNPQTAPAAEGDTAPTEHEPGGQSTASGTASGSSEDGATGEITDDQLPEDLQATDDNPLAKPLEPDGDENSGLSLDADGPTP